MFEVILIDIDQFLNVTLSALDLALKFVETVEERGVLSILILEVVFEDKYELREGEIIERIDEFIGYLYVEEAGLLFHLNICGLLKL